jgi:hypothetical protein
MARRDDQDRYDASGADSRVLATLHRSEPNQPTAASRPDLEQGGADVDRHGQIGTEPTLNEVLHEPVIRLMMKCDNALRTSTSPRHDGSPAYARVRQL